MVSDAQVRLLRQKRMEKKTQETAAATAGMSVRAARKWEKGGPLPSETKRPRGWRTRADAFASVWQTDVVPLLVADKAGILEGKTVLEVLEQRQPGKYGTGQLRTLQRRMRDRKSVV